MGIGKFRLGEDIAVALDVDPTGIAAIVATMVLVNAENVDAIRTSATRIVMTGTPRAADGDIPAGWTFSLSAAQTAAMTHGIYAIDAKMTLTDGTVDITDQPAFVTMLPAAT